ncbi:hypothetical protein AB0I28_35655 [Phytomonospora sp. NPDC050363]|uniref:hypothetical protein n=1 Tax=Phytomonospora sp. NPDC050363 TaxID=3155642 RepID=UPI0033FB17A5
MSAPLLASRPTWNRRRKIALAVLVSVTLLVCGGLAWGAWTSADLGRENDVTLEDLTGYGDLSLPPGSELTEGRGVFWIDWQLYGVVRFPAAELDGFVAANALPEPVPGMLRDYFGGSLAPKPSGTTFATITQACTESACRDMVLVLDDPATVEAWIYAVENNGGTGSGPPSPSES